MKQRPAIKFFALALIAFLMPFLAFGQLESLQSVELVTIPTHPGPRTTVSIEARSFSYNAAQAYYSWYVDGKLLSEGVGAHTLELTTKNVGSASTIEVRVRTESGLSLSKSMVIAPAEVILLWEGLTSTPAFYKGRSLASAGSFVRISAVPHIVQNGTRIPPENLVYTWKRGSKLLNDLSGTGKSTIVIDNPGVLRDLDVSVEVASPNKLITATAFTSISVEEPEVLLYEESPLLGLLTQEALGAGTSLAQKEVTAIAAPFFFALGNLLYNWTVDGQKIDRTENNVTLRQEGEGAARVSVGVTVTHPTAFLEKAAKSATITFSGDTAGVFGF